MSIVTMDMSKNSVERDNLPAVEYGDEVLYAGWNPILGLQGRDADEHVEMPLNLASVDVPVFLKRMYAYQR